MKTAIVCVIAAGALVAATPCRCTEVTWIAMHGYAPQGTSTRVVAGDVDGDGDLDLSMLGVNPPRHYWNVGTPELPAWSLDTTQYTGVPYCGYRAAALGDLDSDGDLDLVVTCYDELLRYYRSAGTPGAPTWVYEPAMFDGVVIVSGGAEPYLEDLDADGDLDMLVVCDFGGVIMHVENVGTAATAEWLYRGIILTVTFGAHPTLALGDLDGDLDPDLVSVNLGAPPECWENVGTPQAFEFAENPSMLTGVDEPPWGKGIELFDVDADGDLDLLITHYMGENFLYLNERITPVGFTSWGRIKALYR